MCLYVHARRTTFTHSLFHRFAHSFTDSVMHSHCVHRLFSMFGRSLPLDFVCRVWDLYIRDGETALFRVACGVLSLFERALLAEDLCPAAQLLSHPPLRDSLHTHNTHSTHSSHSTHAVSTQSTQSTQSASHSAADNATNSEQSTQSTQSSKSRGNSGGGSGTVTMSDNQSAGADVSADVEQFFLAIQRVKISALPDFSPSGSVAESAETQGKKKGSKSFDQIVCEVRAHLEASAKDALPN